MPSFDPVEYCKAAGKIAVLKQKLEGHAAWRTAAGRAYYAVYLATRAALRKRQNDRDLDPGHRELWEELKKPVHPLEIQKLGNEGAVLKKWREYADYEPTVEVSEEDAKKRAEQCHEFMKLLDAVKDKLPYVPPRTRAVAPGTIT